MKTDLYDHSQAEREGIMGEPTEDDLNSEETRAARKAGAVMDGDTDFNALHKLVNGAKLAEDADVQALRKLVNDYNAKRLHAALDRVLDRLRQRRCAGDRAWLKRMGVKP